MIIKLTKCFLSQSTLKSHHFDNPDLTSGAIMGQNSNSQLASDKLKMVNMV